MAFVRRYRVSLVLLVLLGVVVALVVGRLRDQQARAVPRANREIQVGVVKPLARAVIGGLMVSSGLTPILIPTLYTIFEERFPRHLALEEEGAA